MILLSRNSHKTLIQGRETTFPVTFGKYLIKVETQSLEIQWNLDLAKCQGTGEIGSLYRGFVISGFFSTHYTITGLKNIVRYTEDFVT